MDVFLREMGCEPSKRADILIELRTRLSSSQEDAKNFAELGGLKWLRIYMRQHDIILPCLLCLEALGGFFNLIDAHNAQLIPHLLVLFEHPDHEIASKANFLMNKLNEQKKRLKPIREKLKKISLPEEPPQKRMKLEEQKQRPRKVKFDMKNTKTMRFTFNSQPRDIYKRLANEKREKFEPEIPWRVPPLLKLESHFKRGEKSEESQIQERRICTVLEAIYPNNIGIPNSPLEPPYVSPSPSSSDESQSETLKPPIEILFDPKGTKPKPSQSPNTTGPPVWSASSPTTRSNDEKLDYFERPQNGFPPHEWPRDGYHQRRTYARDDNSHEKSSFPHHSVENDNDFNQSYRPGRRGRGRFGFRKGGGRSRGYRGRGRGHRGPGRGRGRGHRGRGHSRELSREHMCNDRGSESDMGKKLQHSFAGTE